MWAAKPREGDQLAVILNAWISVPRDHGGDSGPAEQNDVFGSEYVAANGPAWASPWSLGSQYRGGKIEKGKYMGPSRYPMCGSRRRAIGFAFLPEKLTCHVSHTIWLIENADKSSHDFLVSLGFVLVFFFLNIYLCPYNKAGYAPRDNGGH